MIFNKLVNIFDSYFGKMMGCKIEYGLLLLINMVVGIFDGFML